MYTFPKIAMTITPLEWYRWPKFQGLAHGLYYGVLHCFIYAVYRLGINPNMISWYLTILRHVSPNTSCNIDLIFTPEFFGLLGHTIVLLFLHCRWIAQQPTALTKWLLRRWWEAEQLPFYVHSARILNLHGSVFPRTCACCHSRCW